MKISRTIMVSNNTAYIDAPIYLYKGDGNVLISLDIINITISTKLNQMSTTNYINDNISYATACLCKKDSSSTFHIVGTKVNDKIELELKKDMMDETVEVGEYRMQVHLFDKENNRLTIPVVEEINIMLPLCSDGYAPPIVYSSKIGEATVDYSKVVSESISASSDFYHTYNWTTGEYITANKLNNMITGIDEALYDIKNIQNNYVTKNELSNKANKNEIPTKISQLLNDKGYLTEHQDLSNYATKSYVDSEIANAQLGGDTNIDLNELATKDELNEKANKNDVPTKVSQLTNDKGYLTSIPSEYITETELNNKGYLTEHQSLDDYATKNYVDSEIDKIELTPGVQGEKGEKGEDGLTTSITVNGSTFVHQNGVIVLPDYPEVNSSIDTYTKEEIDDIINDYSGGKKQVYLTQAEYDILNDDDKNDETKVYNIIDVKDTVADSLILTSPNGSKFVITVSDDGTLSATPYENIEPEEPEEPVEPTLTSVSAIYTQGETIIYTDSSLDDLRTSLVVTANYSDGTSNNVTDYTLSGELTVGTSAITVSFGDKTAIFNVTVSSNSQTPEEPEEPVSYTNYIYNSETFVNPTSGNAFLKTQYYLLPSAGVSATVDNGVWNLSLNDLSATRNIQIKHGFADNKIYYIQFKIKTPTCVSAGSSSSLKKIETLDEWITMSYIYTDTNASQGIIKITTRAETVAGSVVQIKEPMKICLTEIYGAGNEPTDVAVCDEAFATYVTGLVG